MDEGGLALVEQDPIGTAVDGVERIHCYHRQAGAGSERAFRDAGDAVGDRDPGQTGGLERLLPDAGDAVRDRDAGQAGAETEREVPDAGDGKTSDLSGNDYITARPGVSGNRDGAVVGDICEISRLSEKKGECKSEGGNKQTNRSFRIPLSLALYLRLKEHRTQIAETSRGELRKFHPCKAAIEHGDHGKSCEDENTPDRHKITSVSVIQAPSFEPQNGLLGGSFASVIFISNAKLWLAQRRPSGLFHVIVEPGICGF